MRYFEKVSLKEFKKNYSENLYDSYQIPVRKTKTSAGYDFMSITDLTIKPNEKCLIPTGIKAKFEEDEVLLIIIRSSLGIKKDIQLCNQVGVIESDYYNNIDNEGHLFICVRNCGNEVCHIKKGSAYAQGVFMKFLTTGDKPETIRVGGIGSTEEGERNNGE